MLGLSIAEFGMMIWYVSVCVVIYYFGNSIVNNETNILENSHLMSWGLFLFVFIIATQIVGNAFISLSQFINWWGRGSVNTKITRNVRK